MRRLRRRSRNTGLPRPSTRSSMRRSSWLPLALVHDRDAAHLVRLAIGEVHVDEDALAGIPTSRILRTMRARALGAVPFHRVAAARP